MLSLGIDEAGRGCIIGNMFIAGVVCDERNLNKLKALGVRDSKMLTRKQRRRLFNIIVKVIPKYYVIEVTPTEIDRENLNLLVYNVISRIISQALQEFPIERIYIDQVGAREKLLHVVRSTGFKGEVIIESKADRRYVIVSAASIIAKVLRDAHIESLKKQYGDLGSGYPSDTKTLSWLKRYYEAHGSLPSIVRKTWSTLKNIAPREYKVKKK